MSGTPTEPPSSAVRPTHRRSRAETILLGTVVILLVLALILPWWTETESDTYLPGGTSSTQSYSPITGVTGVCSSACPPFFPGPPLGPVEGTKSFSSLHLNQTANLYLAALVLVFVALAFSATALATSVGRPSLGPSHRRARIQTFSLAAALLATAIATIALAAFQPTAFRADTIAAFGPNTAWTASPSPEVSFWGSCSVGPANGICASGWAMSWGPDSGWYLLLGAVLALVVIHLIRIRRLPSPAVEPSGSG